MKLQFTRQWMIYKPGDIIVHSAVGMTPGVALTLVQRGFAIEVEDDDKPIETAEAPAPAETAEAPRPRKRQRGPDKKPRKSRKAKE